jgi:hypothetical protein
VQGNVRMKADERREDIKEEPRNVWRPLGMGTVVRFMDEIFRYFVYL